MTEFRSAGAQVLAICTDTVDENAKVVKQLNLDYSILSDPDLQAIDAFDLRHEDAMTASGTGEISRPGVFVLDQNGVVRWRMLTENWRIRVRPETLLEQLAKIP